MNGNAAQAVTDRTLTMTPRERVSNGRNAWVTPQVPNRLTARRPWPGPRRPAPARCRGWPRSPALLWLRWSSVFLRFCGVNRVSGQRAKARAGEQVGGLVVAGAGEVDDRLA